MTHDDVMAYLRQQEVLPFAWGVTDCVQLAAGMIERARGFRPELPMYSSEIEAKRALVDLGGLEAAVTAALGEPRVDLRECQQGDIVLTAFQGDHALGIATPRWFWVRRAESSGLVPLDLTLAKKYWPCQGF